MKKIEYGKHKLVEDSFQSYLVNGAKFTTTEEYPIIRSDMISTKIPDSIMPFEKAINYKGDLSNTFICTYEKDCTFERIRRNPSKYVNFFKRTAGIIGFDYSIHSDMPIIKQKSQMNDNLSLTYFYANQDIPAIPNLRCGDIELQKEFFEAIPKKKLVSVGVHGFHKYKFEKYEWLCFLEDVIQELEPSGIIVYGHLNEQLYDQQKEKTQFHLYDPWINTKGKKVFNYVH